MVARVSEGFLHKGNEFLAGSTMKERNVVSWAREALQAVAGIPGRARPARPQGRQVRLRQPKPRKVAVRVPVHQVRARQRALQAPPQHTVSAYCVQFPICVSRDALQLVHGRHTPSLYKPRFLNVVTPG